MTNPEPGLLAPDTGVAGSGSAADRSERAGTGGAAGLSRSGHDGPADAPNKRKHKKPRKRRRSRKVFARPDHAAQQSVIAGTPEIQPAVQPRPSESLPLQSPPVRRQNLPVFAALDLGTNNCRLLVAVPGRPGQFRVIDAFSRIVRLGEGLSASGKLSDAAMERAIGALRICAEKLGSREIAGARLIATEACRSAVNGQSFVDRVLGETGIRLEIIDRKTEARLAVSGCGSLVEHGTDGVVLFDIGGGSSEIALIDIRGRRSPRLAHHIVAWTSLPVGVVSLAERFGGHEVTVESFAAMVAYVSDLLEGFAERGRLNALIGGRFHLLGTSGTVTTLAGVHLGLERYDRRRVDGLWMDSSSVDAMTEKMLGWSFEERVRNTCIGADRADLVLAGCAILQAIREVWPADRLRVADRGLREGILTELMSDHGVWRRHQPGGMRPGGRA